MTERHESQRAAPGGQSDPRPEHGCLGNGCGDFGFIEDLSTLIALKLLVDEPELEDRPSEAPSVGFDAPVASGLPFTDVHEQSGGRSGSDPIY